MTPAERIAAAEAKRQAIRAAHEAAYADQRASDMEALVELEDEHGYDRILRIDLQGWRAGSGAATMVVARVPLGSESVFARYEDTVSKPQKPGSTAHLNAGHTLAKACLVYPSKAKAPELYDATLELAPGILSHLVIEIAKAVQGAAEEEKKG